MFELWFGHFEERCLNVTVHVCDFRQLPWHHHLHVNLYVVDFLHDATLTAILYPIGFLHDVTLSALIHDVESSFTEYVHVETSTVPDDQYEDESEDSTMRGKVGVGEERDKQGG
mgnify:CR=1 FL=1